MTICLKTVIIIRRDHLAEELTQFRFEGILILPVETTTSRLFW